MPIKDDKKQIQLRKTINELASQNTHLKNQLKDSNRKVSELKETLFFVFYIIALLTVFILTQNEYKIYVLITGFIIGLSIWIIKFDKNK